MLRKGGGPWAREWPYKTHQPRAVLHMATVRPILLSTLAYYPERRTWISSSLEVAWVASGCQLPSRSVATKSWSLSSFWVARSACHKYKCWENGGGWKTLNSLVSSFIMFNTFNWLVVWNMLYYIFTYLGNFIIPADYIICFRSDE